MWENNHHEEECYEEGLRSLYNNDEERVKAAVEGIKQAYDSSQMVNFYPSVAMIVREVRKKSNLYGNYIDASKYNEENRFKQDSENAIYMFDKDNGEPECFVVQADGLGRSHIREILSRTACVKSAVCAYLCAKLAINRQ